MFFHVWLETDVQIFNVSAVLRYYEHATGTVGNDAAEVRTVRKGEGPTASAGLKTQLYIKIHKNLN